MNFQFLVLGLSLAPLLRSEDSLTLSRVLHDVAAQHPEVRATQARARAERERIEQAGAWENTTVGLELMRRATLRPDRADEVEWMVAQKIPLTSQRKRRVELAKADAAVAASRVPARLTSLVIRATDAFYRLARARELLDLTKRNDEVLARGVSAVQSRLADGMTNVASVLLAETARARLQEEVIELEREMAEAATSLNTLRNLPPEAAIGPLDPRENPTGLDSFERLRERALANRPELLAADAQVTAALRATDLATAWIPDPEVIVRARHLRGRSDPISEYDTAIAISVPWFNRGKYRSGVREAEYRREAAELDAIALRSQTVAELRDAWTGYETANRAVKLYQESLLPLAQRSLEAASTGVDSGRSGILELVAAQKNSSDVRNALAGSLAARARAVAVLGAMTGQNLYSPP